MTKTLDQEHGINWTMYQADACDLIKGLSDNSIGFTMYSPPFANLYIYSDSVADMGNCASYDEFFKHYDYLLPELYRVTIPGRLSAVHCKDLPLYMGRDGEAGLWDFPGAIIAAHEKAGWTYHSRVTIWKDPVIEMQRTKNNGLLHKTLCRDSSQSRQGMADYVVIFRKFPEEGLMSDKPVSRPHSQATCFTRYVGETEPKSMSPFCMGGEPSHEENGEIHTSDKYGVQVWQRYASPVWFDIDQTDVLNYRLGKEGSDEKHLCPLQKGVIRRCVELWTNQGDCVLSPFAGVGSEGVVSLEEDRKFIGIELKNSYFQTAIRNLAAVESQRKLFNGV